MRVLLVNMPWALVEVPSLALGILASATRARFPAAEVDVLHANLEYADWALEQGDFTLGDYEYFSLQTYEQGLGDWIFSSALYDDPGWHLDAYADRFRLTARRDRVARRLHAGAPRFTAQLARRIAAWRPDVVGFTSTFQQNTAALAVARHLKRDAPHVVTVFGGANCDGPQGVALHRNFPWVDVVVRGEGDEVFPRLLERLEPLLPAARGVTPGLAGAAGPAGLPGLCHRGADGTPVVEPAAAGPLPPGRIASPHYDDFFERFARSPIAASVAPKLVVEGSRGCWWGEKHHCTFCGLNGSLMEFRAKRPETFAEEVVRLAERHRVLDFWVVDNILAPSHLEAALPYFTEADYDLRMFVEIKSNMRLEGLRRLAAAGMVHVQPGIENLSSRVLSLMDKGVSGCLNVRMLRDAETAGLTVSWNYLHGFPGECAADYEPAMAQFPVLHHLQPARHAARLRVERFSPFFDRPELGFGKLRADPRYSLVYDLPEAELYDLAYLFETEEQGIDAELSARLKAELRVWQRAHRTSRLTRRDLGSSIAFVSSRPAFAWTAYELTDPVEIAAFRLLDNPRTPAGLARRLGVAAARLEGMLERWRAMGLLFGDDGQLVHVVPEATNAELRRLPVRKPGDTALLSTEPEGTDA
ncbi:RiPP maturation radical SAM C-methyltransferase [Streptomyces hiroshimensis]|uniref:RiPP maturation radical SAM protein 1 n=1 Tax=Streptomyces hiroshimensis TaxID=66424 RepID=A0ABQ2YZY7_9ACTN|nr:RiPP maturation radical SAM C-methyltransferase [Streptomyces hiroshimensis]GGX97953.1 RiPP maturation radical SAM protein 1 [Streptomyces hiroshimensis]